ncbi:MAG: pilus assembly protein MshD [Gammaproteobacteria bacterium]|nr:pilus assembly protein MshD [Gammaproteobacteria bacterium]NIR81805.1 pilus assembly protein MshD [Gammaproteobacteria bacterium]NIR88637.1 pilus assembly protein MshD [Gammaproteobacteria bacterium]NIU02913.1 pilus assembly protein MshD [Gammaproteobacteria bacterium]NIV50434.1 pilus assembly protein MshD [Gammaproteobacteria bacterium]
MLVIGVAVGGVLRVMSLVTANSAEPLFQVQAHAIAQSYLEEILLRDFSDPDASEAGEDRSSYDDVDDYDGLANNGCLTTSAACPVLGDCACDQFGNPIDALPGYNVNVNVNPVVLNGVPALRVDVTVTHDRNAGVNLTLSGHRTNY